jgi:hypothetical protein
MQPPHDDDAPPQQKSGCGLKWLVLLGILFGGGALVCCGACGFLGFTFVPKVVQTPADVTALTQEIVDVKVPADFQPVNGMKLDNFAMAIRGATYRQQQGRGHLQFLEVAVKFGDPAANEAQFKQQFRQSQNGQELKVLKIDQSEVREFPVRGQPVSFRFEEGSDVSSATKYRQVSGEFPGKNGPASLTLQVEEDAWNEEAVVEMLKSMQ